MKATKAITDTKHRLRMEIKEISATGEFEGLLSVYGNVDQGGDLVEPGAFTKTIQERGTQVPLLWQHRPDTPIGMLSLQDGPDALRVKGQLLMDLPEAKKAYLLIKARIVKGLSIGFETMKDHVADGIRRLKELRLFEGSIVTFPMNEMATITNVKQANGEPGDFNEELNEIQVRSAHFQYLQALDNALCEVRWSDLSKDEQVTAAQAIIEQFSEAYMSYLPAYVDMMAEIYGPMEAMGRRDLELKGAAKTKRVDGVDLPPSSFAYVGDAQKTETWKLPINFPGDDAKTKSHIRNALARFSQTQGIPESEKPKVLAKIHAAAKKHGIDVADKAVAHYLVELKEGRTISAATKAQCKAIAECMEAGTKSHKDAYDLLNALYEDEAGESTSSSGAAESKTSEAGQTTSAAEGLMDNIRALIPKA